MNDFDFYSPLEGREVTAKLTIDASPFGRPGYCPQRYTKGIYKGLYNNGAAYGVLTEQGYYLIPVKDCVLMFKN